MADSIADRSSAHPQNRCCKHNCSRKTILCVKLVCVSLVFHGGSEKCILAWSGREEEILTDHIRCNLKSDLFFQWERFGMGFFWMK